MEYVNLGKWGVKVSRLCLGTMMFGGPTDESDSIDIIHQALDDGINFLDTANVYNRGQSERVVGKAISAHRDQVILTTKVSLGVGSGPNDQGNSRFHIIREVENSLRRLGTEYIDLYMLHRPDYSTPLSESMEALDHLVRQGKVRYLGLSNFYAWQACSAHWISEQRRLAPVACVQSLYNIVNRDIEVEMLPFCQRHGVGVMAYSPLARGVLTGKYRSNRSFPEGSRAARGDVRIGVTELREESFTVARQLESLAGDCGKSLPEFALNWVLGNPIVSSAIIGPRTREQYELSLGALGWTMDPDVLAQVDRLVPPGEHTGHGFNDPQYPVRGRPGGRP